MTRDGVIGLQPFYNYEIDVIIYNICITIIIITRLVTRHMPIVVKR